MNIPLQIINPSNESQRHDDIRILDSYVEYEDDEAKYLIYKIMLREGNEPWHELYKVIKLARLHRIPKKYRELETLMDIHDEIFTGLHSSKVNFINIIANILEPPIGLLFLYGVQELDTDLERAKEYADQSYAAVFSQFKGAIPQIKLKPMSSEEADWLRKKMYDMNYLQIVRGIPLNKASAAHGTEDSMMGDNSTPGATEQNEEFIRGMSDEEFVMLTLASPIEFDDLNNWLDHTADELSKWQSELQGTKGINFGISMPMVFMSNLGSAMSENASTSEGISETEGFSQGETISQSESFSESQSIGHSEGESFTQTQSESFGENQSISESQSTSFSESRTVSNSVSEGRSFSQGENISQSQGINQSESLSQSEGSSFNEGVSQGRNFSQSENMSEGISQGENWSNSQSQSESVSQSQSQSFNQSRSQGESFSENFNQSQSNSQSVNEGVNRGANISQNRSQGESLNKSASNRFGANWGVNYSDGVSFGEGVSQSEGIGAGQSAGESFGQGASQGESFSEGFGQSNSYSESMGTSQGVSSSESASQSNSQAVGGSNSVSQSRSQGTSEGASFGRSQSQGRSFGTSASQSQGRSFSNSQGQSVSQSQNVSSSKSVSNSTGVTQSEGTTVSRGQSHSTSQSVSQGQSRSTTTSQSTGRTEGTSTAESKTHSQNQGTSYNKAYGTGTTVSRGSSSSMAIGPSISANKTVQWFDANKETLAHIIEAQRDRLLKAIQQGAFYVDIYVMTLDQQSKAAAGALLKSAFWGKEVFPSPVQILEPEQDISEHLFVHATAFSACTAKESILDKIEGYRYTTILLPEELTSYVHTPRLEQGGLRTVTENIPYFSVPRRDDGEIHLGKVINPETGEPSKMPYNLRKEELMHGMIAGASGTGKTVSALQYISQVVNKLNTSALILDWKRDWRILKHIVPEERFEFYGLDPNSPIPVKMNILIPPKHVRPTTWRDKVIESLCVAFGLGSKQYGILYKAMQRIYLDKDIIEYYDLQEEKIEKGYDQNGIIKLPDRGLPNVHENWKENIRNVTLSDLYIQLQVEQQNLDRNSRGLYDSYDSLLTRLGFYVSGELRKLYASTDPDAYSISDLVEEDKIMVLEGDSLDQMNKKFIIHLFAQGIFLYAKERPRKEQLNNEKLVVFEEAHQVISDKDEDIPLPINEDIFEALMNESRGFGLYNLIIVQSPSGLPTNVRANCSTVIGHRVGDEQDASTLVKLFNREEKRDNRDMLRWMFREPIGQAVVKTSKVFDAMENEPALVKMNYLPIEPPSNRELIQHHKRYVKVNSNI